MNSTKAILASSPAIEGTYWKEHWKMQNEQTSAEIASIAGRILAGDDFTTAEVRAIAASCLTQTADKEVKGLPVAGYKPTQPETAIRAVNVFKELEERTLRHIEILLGDRPYLTDRYPYHPNCDLRMLHVGRTQLQLAFMALNRAVFQPGRVELPED
jgi:hypothetical protein